ncbi:MAG: hypothetical protein ACKOEX_13360 [Planctomycetia bacterium]
MSSFEKPRDNSPLGDAHPRLMQLINLAIEGEINAAEKAELEQMLAADAAARRQYVDAMFLDAMLDEEFASCGVADMVDMLVDRRGDPPTPAARSWTSAATRAWPDLRGSRAAALIGIALTLAAAALGTGITAWQVVRAGVGMSNREPLGEISRTRLALLATKPGSQPERVTKGRAIGRERLAIASGAVELTLRGGHMIVLEGPSELELIDEREAFLHHGAAVVRAAGDGFTLETPTAGMSCVAGEFAAKVDASLTSDVQVYEGDIVVSGVAKLGSGQFPDRLAAGEARRFSPRPDMPSETLAFSAERFVRRVPDDTGIGMPVTVAVGDKTGQPRLESLVVTQTVEPVTIDGNLDDWKPAHWFRAGGGAGSIEGGMMFDADNLYVAARVGDPLPMRNSVDPHLDPQIVWHGGGLQIFFSGDRATGWPADANGPSYYINRKTDAPFAERIKAENPRLVTLMMIHHAPTQTDHLFLGRAPSFGPASVAAESFSGRFVRHPDGRGYTLEYAIPWSTLGLADDPPQSGDRLATAWELHFSDETGRLWRNQIIEIRNQSEPPGIFLFERAATWGRADFR